MKQGRLHSLVTTGLLWVYWIGAFVAVYWVIFLVAGLVRRRRGIAWALGHYAGGFFTVACLLARRVRIEVHSRAQLRQTSGSVVVCNHISFLDPLLLVSLLPRVITIVRPDFFRVPIFGWLLRGAGFLGPDLFAEGRPWLDKVARHLRAGGNLLIFPEGTRSRDGKLAPFKKGAFYLAKHLGAPILVLKVAGTDQVFPPGQLTFHATPDGPIDVQAVARISAAEAADATTHELTQRVFGMLRTPPTSTTT
jgi:1-acyl-sn-glycerol-3-phosphate acyltransferase